MLLINLPGKEDENNYSLKFYTSFIKLQPDFSIKDYCSMAIVRGTI